MISLASGNPPRKSNKLWCQSLATRAQLSGLAETFYAGDSVVTTTSGISSCKTFFYYIFYVNDLVLPEKWLKRGFLFSLKYPFLAKFMFKIKMLLQKLSLVGFFTYFCIHNRK